MTNACIDTFRWILRRPPVMPGSSDGTAQGASLADRDFRDYCQKDGYLCRYRFLRFVVYVCKNMEPAFRGSLNYVRF
jgi:hypothetical protein